jgi:hypothetical protein
MNKKYELTSETKDGLKRIRALRDIVRHGVKVGDLGGYIQSEENLCHDGDAWVHENAWVFGNARVSGDALISGDATVSDDARVFGNARVYDNASVAHYASVSGNARVYGDAIVVHHASVCRTAQVHGDTLVSGNTRLVLDAYIKSNYDYCTFTNVDIDNNILTVYKNKNGILLATCMGFSGTLDDFEIEVNKNSTDQIKKEYALLIEFTRLRLGNKS